MSDFGSKKILIVDDTAFMRATLVKLLAELGFSKNKIVECENGLSAMNTLKNDPHFDLVLTDWNMPELNGLGVIKAIRQLEGAVKNIPVVFVTTVSEKDKVIEAIKYRLSGYIIKPVDKTKLTETIDDVFLEEAA